jgi:antitoxin component YwqK of YwqJK toxin-antitoxin module
MKKAYRKYHNDGSLWAKGFLYNGNMVGSWTWFRKDGSKMRSGSFDKGTQTGKWTTFDKKGNVVKVTMLGK